MNFVKNYLIMIHSLMCVKLDGNKLAPVSQVGNVKSVQLKWIHRILVVELPGFLRLQ